MTFSVARYESLGSRILGVPKNGKRKWTFGAGCSNANATFMKYLTQLHNTETMVTCNTADLISL